MQIALAILCLLGGMAQVQAVEFKQQLVPFQGRLYDQGNTAVTDGLHKLTFEIFMEASTGKPIWQESHDNVSVINGYVSVILGASEPLVYQEDKVSGNPTLSSLKNQPINFTESDFYVSVAIDGGAPLFPRQQLIPSFHARTSDKSKYLVSDNETPKIVYSAKDIYEFETAHWMKITELDTFSVDYFKDDEYEDYEEIGKIKAAKYADTLDGHDSSYFAQQTQFLEVQKRTLGTDGARVHDTDRLGGVIHDKFARKDIDEIFAQDVTVNGGDLYIHSNGNSDIHFWDQNSSVWRPFFWDNHHNRFSMFTDKNRHVPVGAGWEEVWSDNDPNVDYTKVYHGYDDGEK
ncbi:MAG: hypothetical protein OXE99_15460, partial [Cellvibrionales bacterium]|nr:hypothetical protein [Cellvibrionales bacterium]